MATNDIKVLQEQADGSLKETVLTPTTIGAAPAVHAHSDATQSVAGFLSASDKTKLDKVSVSGNGVRINVSKGVDITDTVEGSYTEGQTFTGGNSGVIEAKGSDAAIDSSELSGGSNGLAGGSVLVSAGTSGNLVGGAGGTLDLRGGPDGGGSGGQILISGGGGTGLASQFPAGNGGSINLSGGSSNYSTGGGAGGQILMTGGNGGTDSGGNAGTLNLSGGYENLQNGGSIDLSDGGGSINLRGTGSIEFGLNGIRTTLSGTATDNRSISLPNASGILALEGDATVELVIACSDETSNLTVGANKVTFRSPCAFTLTGVRASVNTAPTGSTLIVDINEAGTSVLSTKLSIDTSEKTSVIAASAAVISDSSIADDAEITIDIDQIGSTIAGKGLKVVLIGTRL